ncbi:MAG TPA: hypothetical protein VGC42_12155 [Kofleriaceae bacterium]
MRYKAGNQIRINKLTCHRDTVRDLSTRELRAVLGGGPPENTSGMTSLVRPLTAAG